MPVHRRLLTEDPAYAVAREAVENRAFAFETGLESSARVGVTVIPVSGTDFVEDTPNAGGPNVGKPTFPLVTCNNAPDGDMFGIFMDYTDDAAMFMFTQGQAARMDATLEDARSSFLKQQI